MSDNVFLQKERFAYHYCAFFQRPDNSLEYIDGSILITKEVLPSDVPKTIRDKLTLEHPIANGKIVISSITVLGEE